MTPRTETAGHGPVEDALLKALETLVKRAEQEAAEAGEERTPWLDNARAAIAQAKEEKYAYEVQTYTLADGWMNCWQDDDGNPVLFPTLAEAQEELADYRQDCEEAVACGDMQSNDDRLRIRKIIIRFPKA